MSKKGVKITAAVIAVVFILGIVGPLLYSMAFSEPVDRAAELKAQIAETEKRISELNAEADAARELKKTKLDESAGRLRAICEKGLSSYIEIIFSAEKPSDFTDRAVIVRELMEYDKNMTNALSKIQNEIETKKADANLQLERQKAAEAELLAMEKNK